MSSTISGGRKIASWFLLLSFLFMLVPPKAGQTAPTGGQVVSGSASITQNATQTIINQITQQAIIDWTSFGINPNQLVQFLQPNQLSAILNRVTGGNPSLILGSLKANGNVFLINPNGILFGANSVVDVGSLVASTLDISNSNFMNKNYAFNQTSSQPSFVINEGSINASNGGNVALLGGLVDNEGNISAPEGTAALGAGTSALLSYDGQGLVNLVVPAGSGAPGNVEIPASVLPYFNVNNILAAVVNNKQILSAGSVSTDTSGNVVLDSAGGLALNAGSVKANGASGVKAGSLAMGAAQAAVMTPGSLLQANGVGANSNGGTVSVKSQGSLWLEPNATIEAKGGLTGNGGNVTVDDVTGGEVAGMINVTASNGTAGSLFLDPTVIELTATGTDADADGTSDSGLAVTDTLVSVAGLSGAVVETADDIFIDTQSGGTLTFPVAVTSVTLNATPTVAGQGNVVFEDFADTLSVSGPLTINAGNATFGGFANVGNLTATAVTVNAQGLVFIDNINAGAGNVSLTSATSDIEQFSGTITANTLTMSAATGIFGFFGSVITNVNNLQALNTTSGTISIDNTSTNPLTIGEFGLGTNAGIQNKAVGGAINLTTNGDLDIPMPAGTASPATVDCTAFVICGVGLYASGGGDINVTAFGNLNSGTVNSGETAESDGGNVNLTAFGNMNLGNGHFADVYANGSSANGEGNINLLAFGNLNVSNETFIKTFANASTSTANAGDIFLETFGNLTFDANFDRVQTNWPATSSTVGNIQAESFGTGGITLNNAVFQTGATQFTLLEAFSGPILSDGVTTSITGGGSAFLRASGGIGSVTFPLITAVSQLQASNNTAGDIVITNTGDLTIDDFGFGIGAFNGVGILNSATGGNITLVNNGDINFAQTFTGFFCVGFFCNAVAGVLDSGGGNVNLTAQGTDGALNPSNINSGLKGSGTTAESDGGNVNLTAAGNINLGTVAAGPINQFGDVITDGGTANITLTAANNIALAGTSEVGAFTSAISPISNAGNVALTATTGNITFDNTLDVVLSVAGDFGAVTQATFTNENNVSLTATAGAINLQGGAVEAAAVSETATAAGGFTNVANVTLTANGAGGITLNNSLAVTELAADNGSFSNAANLTLKATAGGISMGGAPLLPSATGINLLLNSGYTSTTPLLINNSGNITLTASGAIAFTNTNLATGVLEETFDVNNSANAPYFIVSNSANITLTSGAGNDISFNGGGFGIEDFLEFVNEFATATAGPVKAANIGNINLNSGGNITFQNLANGGISAPASFTNFGATAAGNIVAMNVGDVALSAAGNITFENITGDGIDFSSNFINGASTATGGNVFAFQTGNLSLTATGNIVFGNLTGSGINGSAFDMNERAVATTTLTGSNGNVIADESGNLNLSAGSGVFFGIDPVTQNALFIGGSGISWNPDFMNGDSSAQAGISLTDSGDLAITTTTRGIVFENIGNEGIGFFPFEMNFNASSSKGFVAAGNFTTGTGVGNLALTTLAGNITFVNIGSDAIDAESFSSAEFAFSAAGDVFTHNLGNVTLSATGGQITFEGIGGNGIFMDADSINLDSGAAGGNAYVLQTANLTLTATGNIVFGNLGGNGIDGTLFDINEGSFADLTATGTNGNVIADETGNLNLTAGNSVFFGTNAAGSDLFINGSGILWDPDFMSGFAFAQNANSLTDSGDLAVTATTGNVLFKNMGNDGIEFFPDEMNFAASAQNGFLTTGNFLLGTGVGNLTVSSPGGIVFADISNNGIDAESFDTAAFASAGTDVFTTNTGNVNLTAGGNLTFDFIGNNGLLNDSDSIAFGAFSSTANVLTSNSANLNLTAGGMITFQFIGGNGFNNNDNSGMQVYNNDANTIASAPNGNVTLSNAGNVTLLAGTGLTFNSIFNNGIFVQSGVMNGGASAGGGTSVTNAGNLSVTNSAGQLTFENIGGFNSNEGDGIDFFSQCNSCFATAQTGDVATNDAGNLTVSALNGGGTTGNLTFNNIFGDGIFMDSDTAGESASAVLGNVTTSDASNFDLTAAGTIFFENMGGGGIRGVVDGIDESASGLLSVTTTDSANFTLNGGGNGVFFNNLGLNGIFPGILWDPREANEFATSDLGVSLTDSGNLALSATTGDIVFSTITGDGIDFYPFSMNAFAVSPSGSLTAGNGALVTGVGNSTLFASDLIVFENLGGVYAVYQDADSAGASAIAGAGALTINNFGNMNLSAGGSITSNGGSFYLGGFDLNNNAIASGGVTATGDTSLYATTGGNFSLTNGFIEVASYGSSGTLSVVGNLNLTATGNIVILNSSLDSPVYLQTDAYNLTGDTSAVGNITLSAGGGVALVNQSADSATDQVDVNANSYGILASSGITNTGNITITASNGNITLVNHDPSGNAATASTQGAQINANSSNNIVVAGGVSNAGNVSLNAPNGSISVLDTSLAGSSGISANISDTAASNVTDSGDIGLVANSGISFFAFNSAATATVFPSTFVKDTSFGVGGVVVNSGNTLLQTSTGNITGADITANGIGNVTLDAVTGVVGTSSAPVLVNLTNGILTVNGTVLGSGTVTDCLVNNVNVTPCP